jgi:hypothetical protein
MSKPGRLDERMLAATRLLQYRSHERFLAAAANAGRALQGEDHG